MGHLSTPDIHRHGGVAELGCKFDAQYLTCFCRPVVRVTCTCTCDQVGLLVAKRSLSCIKKHAICMF